MKKRISYDHTSVEEKWQRVWEEQKINAVDISVARKPFYNLMMFPYPSAEGLHVGNMYAFTGTDVYGRFKRLQGYEVFEPIGLDGFGIHSENYALKVGRHPMDHAQITEKNFYAQLRRIGAMYDWGRTVETYSPDYYKWTQWLFIQMFKHGLAYRSTARVNWCPSCKTVLADEQVIEGKCERCGNLVEKRPLEQWFFKITAYAEKLLQNSYSLDWSEKVRVAQQNWIGKKEGITIRYSVANDKGDTIGDIECFTTRPETNFGATFVVIAPEHHFITQLIRVLSDKKTVTAIKKYCTSAAKKTEAERTQERGKKTGIFTGFYCINQLTGERLPLYISDFVLMGFGTGAVVGVPGSDARDFEFSRAFNVPIKRVVVGADGITSEITKKEEIQDQEGVMVNSDFLDDLPVAEARAKMIEYLTKKGWGSPVTTYHLRDWIISRQRYWGPPIPMIFCKACAQKGKSWFTTEEAKTMAAGSPAGNDLHSNAGWYPVPESDLPVLLPRIEDYTPGDDGIAPLAKHREFYEVACPGCGEKATRETDVSDTFLDSSWYFLRYPSVNGETSSALPWDPDITKKWLPVSMYTGGAEHSVLHLMYSRFVTMALKDWGYLDFEEPFPHFYAHGLVIKDGAKMSKSKGNVVNPDEYIRLYGADALRLYLMFMGPFDQGGDFRDSAMEGMSRWTGRVWRIVEEVQNQHPKESSAKVKTALQKLIKRVGDDLEKRRYNTAIAGMMEFTNLVDDEGGVLDPESLRIFVILLAPFAPYLAEEAWARINISEDIHSASNSVHNQRWPSYDPERIKDEELMLIVQVNGKLRDRLVLSAVDAQNRKIVEDAARSSQKVQTFLAEKTEKQVIFVPGKLINFVV